MAGNQHRGVGTPREELPADLTFDHDQEAARRFFRAVCERFPCAEQTSAVIVTHILRDRPVLLEALSRVTRLELVLAKPRSIHEPTLKMVAQRYRVQTLESRFTDGPSALEMIASHCDGRPVALLDIGGYFADVGDFFQDHYSGGLLGIVEDTENGVQKYEKANPRYSLLSVARSPLKNPEDFLVGQSIVHSVEALLREQGHILHGRTACVIGYGKLGRSIAHLLHARHVRTVVFDRDPIRQVEAMSHGFPVGSDLRKALRDAGLVICATGNLALRRPDFALLENGAYVATVTSSDDELEIGDLHRDYRVERVTNHMVRHIRPGHDFYLMNSGQAVNFIHGASVGAFIYLVQAEMLAGLSAILKGESPMGISESSADVRREIADVWLDHFGPDARGKASDA